MLLVSRTRSFPLGFRFCARGLLCFKAAVQRRKIRLQGCFLARTLRVRCLQLCFYRRNLAFKARNRRVAVLNLCLQVRNRLVRFL